MESELISSIFSQAVSLGARQLFQGLFSPSKRFQKFVRKEKHIYLGHLVERSHPTPTIRGSNLTIASANLIGIVLFCWAKRKGENKRKRGPDINFFSDIWLDFIFPVFDWSGQPKNEIFRRFTEKVRSDREKKEIWVDREGAVDVTATPPPPTSTPVPFSSSIYLQIASQISRQGTDSRKLQDLWLRSYQLSI